MTKNLQSFPSSVTAAGGKMLSVYLDTDQGNAANLNRGYETALDARLRIIGESLAQNVERKEFDAAAALIQDFVVNRKPSGKALVIFADASRILFSRELQVEVPTELQWGKPRVAPYIEALDEFERQTIVVTDKWRARILSVFLGVVETSTEIQDTPHTTHIHATGMDQLESQARNQRHADENATKHVKHIIRSLEGVLASYPSDRIVLGGNIEAVGELFRLLPKALKYKIVATVHSAMADSFEKVIETAAEVCSRTERDLEKRAVERLIELAGERHKAVVGPVDTVYSVREKRLLCLYYAEGFKLAGKSCVQCGTLFASGKPAPCAYCGAHLEDSEDLLDQALVATLDCGARIEQVRGAAAEKLRDVGSIGALLRF